MLPLLAGERLDLFEAYKGEVVEWMFTARTGGWIASFISYGSGRVVYVGTYEIGAHA